MIPGFSNAASKIPEGALESQQAKIAKWEHIIKSMTPDEINNPEIFDKQTSRISRVAQGAGVNNSEVRALLKQYKMLSEMIKSGMAGGDSENPQMNQKQMQKLMKKFGRKTMRL